MNRYAARGLLQDAADGRRVVVASGSMWASRAAFDEVAQLAAVSFSGSVARVLQGNGRQSIRMASGGWVAFATSLRGWSADVVFVDGPAADTHVGGDAAAAVACSERGEVVRA